MSRERYDVSALVQFVGQELGVSDWLTVDQGRINEFADCTGDQQWRAFLLKFQNTVEIEDGTKPALIAETLALLLPGG
jgi:hypothetical protein